MFKKVSAPYPSLNLPGHTTQSSTETLREAPACFTGRVLGEHSAPPQGHRHVIGTTKLAVKIISFTFVIAFNVISFISFTFRRQRRKGSPLSSTLSHNKATYGITINWNVFIIFFHKGGHPHCLLTPGPFWASVSHLLSGIKPPGQWRQERKTTEYRVLVNAGLPGLRHYLRKRGKPTFSSHIGWWDHWSFMNKAFKEAIEPLLPRARQ